MLIDEMLATTRGKSVLCVTRNSQRTRGLIEDIMRADSTARPTTTAGRERVDFPCGRSIVFVTDRTLERARGRRIDAVVLADMGPEQFPRDLAPLQADLVIRLGN